MLNKLVAFARRYEMLAPGDVVICAVSGGADSVALLWAMYLLKEKLDIYLEAAHFNHGLRGAESDRDEAFVRELCSRFDIPLHVGRGQVEPGEKGLEAAAREARYAFFDTLSGKIATAHTADDNAETVLMHLVRGTGLKGLGGIMPVRGRIIRPMLTVTRQEVLAFLEEYHLGYVTDSSNETDAFLRNRLRHAVMPLLKAENPRLSQQLSAMALELREDEAALQAAIPQGEALDIRTLREMPAGLRSRTLAAFLKRWGVREPERTHIRLAERLVFSEKPAASGDFPGNVTLRRVYGKLTGERALEPLTEVSLAVGETISLRDGLQVSASVAEQVTNEPERFTVAPVGRMVLRSRRAGDTMRTSGGTKSLKKLYIDRKIPASQRAGIPVLADDAGVLGVWGIGANLDRVGAGVELRFWKEKRENEEDSHE